MKKLFGVIIFVLVFGAAAVWFFRVPIISFYLSKKAKIPISIGSIEFSKSSIKIGDFQIKNPAGYKEPTAYSCKTLEIVYNKKDLPSSIESIVLQDNNLYIECENAICSNNNWTQIISKVSEKEKKSKDTEEVIVKKISIDRLNVNIVGFGLNSGVKNLGLDKIEFTNVSSKRGFPIQQIIAVLFKKAGLTDYVKDIFNKEKIFDKYFNPFNMFGENERGEIQDKAI